MRVAHVVTYVSPDGAYGGPMRVALNQAATLSDLGHDVTVFAAAPITTESSEHYDEKFTLRTFPSKYVTRRGGYAGMRAVGMRGALRASANNFDVAHIHLARDLVTIPAAMLIRKLGIPYVTQSHGMIDPSNRKLASVLDRLATAPILESAGTVLYLTEEERIDISQVAPRVSTWTHLTNGVPEYEIGEARNDASRIVISFLARLHPVKRPAAFVRSAINLVERHPDAIFRVGGPDEGELPRLRALLSIARSETRIHIDGAIQPHEVPVYLSNCDIFVLPSETESFGMSALEAMALGKPVVVTDGCALASEIAAYGAGLVVSQDVADLENAIEQLIISSPAERMSMGQRAATLARKYSMKTVADSLVHAYKQVESGTPEQPASS